MLGAHPAPQVLPMPCQPARTRRGMLSNAAGHSGAAGSTPRQDMGTGHTLIRVRPQTRQCLTDPSPVHGTQWHCGSWQGTAQVTQLGRWAGAGGRGWRMHSPYLAEQVGQDNVRQRAGEAGELRREQRELLHCPGCLLPQEAARTGRRGRGPSHLGSCPVNPAFAVGVDVHKDQPFDQVREDELQ